MDWRDTGDALVVRPDSQAPESVSANVDWTKKSGAVGLAEKRLSQGIFHCKAARREWLIGRSERDGERWWLQMSELSKEEPGFDWSRRTRQEAESIWPQV